MKHSLSHILFAAFLLPIYLLAPLLCICMETAAVAEVNHATPASSSHVCCEHQDGDADHDHENQTPEHDSHHCSHCDQSTFTAVSDRPATLQHAPQLLPLGGIAAADLLFVGSYALDVVHVRLIWLQDPSPPPDLLRVKCILQI